MGQNVNGMIHPNLLYSTRPYFESFPSLFISASGVHSSGDVKMDRF